MTDPKQPATEAGRALMAWLREMYPEAEFGPLTVARILAIEAEAAERDAGLREAARDLYSIAVGEHGHDEAAPAVWPSCLPAHFAMNRYRAALAGSKP